MIYDYVKQIGRIFEGKELGILSDKAHKELIGMFDRIGKKDTVHDVVMMATFYFDSMKLAARINEDWKEFDIYSDYLSALSDVVYMYYEHK